MNKAEEIARLYSIYAKRLNRTKLTAEEFQPLVLNMAYLEIAVAKKTHTPYDTRKLFNEYTQAALSVIPTKLTAEELAEIQKLYSIERHLTVNNLKDKLDYRKEQALPIFTCLDAED
jgi:predicted metal-dependent TIM-barrel fold hydrolase